MAGSFVLEDGNTKEGTNIMQPGIRVQIFIINEGVFESDW